ncbi:MAG: hypothetical protein ACE5HQ_12010 [Gemmatimonadota bacterium]
MKPSRARVLQEGLVAGLIGYATIALFYFVVDIARGRPLFFTAALLGRTVSGGSGSAAEVVVAPGPVFAYNGIHLLAFLFIGLAVAWLVFELELHPVFWYVVFFLLLGGFFMSLVIMLAVAERLAELIPWWSVLGANLLTAAAMGMYLHAAHRRLWRELRGTPPSE